MSNLCFACHKLAKFIEGGNVVGRTVNFGMFAIPVTPLLMMFDLLDM